jgi:hypothetical protein
VAEPIEQTIFFPPAFCSQSDMQELCPLWLTRIQNLFERLFKNALSPLTEIYHTWKTILLWDVTQWSFVTSLPTIRRNICLHLQSRIVSQGSNQFAMFAVCFLLVVYFSCSSILRMEATGSSETPLLSGTTQKTVLENLRHNSLYLVMFYSASCGTDSTGRKRVRT